MHEAGDRELLKDILKGSRKAMEMYYHRFSPYLYAVCLRYVTDADVAKDLLHDSFIRIFSSLHTFRFDERQDDDKLHSSLKAWSARVTANVALNYLRDSRHMRFVALDSADYDDIPDEKIEAESLPIEVITAMIEELPVNYRTVFNLFAIEGYSHREIANMLGISETLSATHYHRAKAAMKKKIQNYLDNNL